jgi:CheY-like chemotaxis protein/anti-sigma regulatory factor (Ser/Thr protein kinase)
VSVLADVFNIARPIAEAKGIRLCAHWRETSGMVDADPVRLQQVIENLLSNAIKFTPAGGRIEVWLECRGQDLCIVISDTGIGIDQNTLPYIFDRYRQNDSSSSRRHGGLGLGLALVKHLVELHGGSIEATSKGIELGSVFTVKLPLSSQTGSHGADCPTLRTGSSIELPVAATVEGIRIMAVDDQQEARRALAGFLSKSGASVMAVSSGSEALSILADMPSSEWPDVFICDIAMPDEDGYAVMRCIRALEEQRGIKMSRRIPAIALTALAGREDWVCSLRAGFNRHVAKPVEPAELVTIISSLARDRSRSTGE